MHNWEVLIHFDVHGKGSHLFGDGFAVWYTKEKSEPGEVAAGMALAGSGAH